MTDRSLADLQVFEDTVARLRLVIVALTALAWQASSSPSSSFLLWFGAVSYSVGILLAQPHRHLPVQIWQVSLSLVDWILISAGIYATGGAHSDLYVLYFVLVLSVALRTGPFSAAVVGLFTAAAYLTATSINSGGMSGMFPALALRAAYIGCIAVGSSLIAAEILRQKHARSTAEAGRTAVQDITAAVSHDLLNPLSAIFGLVENLQDDPKEPLTKSQQESLARITSNARRMTALVRNLLDSEALERGTPTLVLRSIDVNGLIERCVDANACDAAARKITVDTDLDADLPRTMVDELLIERLLNNLLHNALKFTPGGGNIRLSTRRGAKSFQIEVWNSAPPIAEELRPVLFEKHTRCAGSSGVGLGLYICKLAARLHDGNIAVSHPRSGGVAFVVELPLRRTPEATKLRLASPALAHGQQAA
jgi:signal transduction histidine kinase